MEAVEGVTFSLSTPFYTSRQEYKCVPGHYLDGDGVGKDPEQTATVLIPWIATNYVSNFISGKNLNNVSQVVRHRSL